MVATVDAIPPESTVPTETNAGSRLGAQCKSLAVVELPALRLVFLGDVLGRGPDVLPDLAVEEFRSELGRELRQGG
jgi:hypothetical protein